jgi:hypothetical protein
VTAPTLSERLRSRAWEDRQHRELRAAAADEIDRQAAEIASLESQLEAVRLAKPAHHEPPYVDGYFGER